MSATSGYAKKIEQLIEQRDSLRAVNADLLSALKGVVRVADRATDEFDAARAAIARATAQSDRALLENK